MWATGCPVANGLSAILACNQCHAFTAPKGASLVFSIILAVTPQRSVVAIVNAGRYERALLEQRNAARIGFLDQYRRRPAIWNAASTQFPQCLLLDIDAGGPHAEIGRPTIFA